MKHGNVVEFRAASQAALISCLSEAAVIIPLPARSAKALPNGGASDTSINKRLRKERRTAWYVARARAELWRARLDICDRVALAQLHRLPEVLFIPPHDPIERDSILANWRAARMAWILTPAPDAASVVWKRRVVEGFSQWDWAGVEPDQVEAVIADDDTFLKTHPMRRPK